MLPSDFTKGRPMTLSEILTLIQICLTCVEIGCVVGQNHNIQK